MFLFINTASDVNMVALFGRRGGAPRRGEGGIYVIAEKKWTSSRDQAEKVLPAIEALLKKHGLGFQDIRGICAVTGPGPYTSVRIGIAIANALGYILGISVRGIRLDEVARGGVAGGLACGLDNIAKKLFSKSRNGFIKPFYSKPPNITKPKND